MTSKDLEIRYKTDTSGVQKGAQQVASIHERLGTKLKSIGESMKSVGKTMSTHVTAPIVAGFAVAIHLAEENAVANRLLERSLVSAGMKGGKALKDLTGFSVHLSEQIGVSQIELKTLEGRVISMGHSFFASLGPAAAGKDIKGLTVGMENLSAASGKSISILMRSLAPSILNAPDKAVTSLEKFGVLTQKQADHIKAMTKAGHAQAATQLELNLLMNSNAGAAAKAATPLAKLKVTMENLAIVVGRILQPFVEKLVGWIQKAAAWFEHLSPSVKKIIVVMLAVAAAIGPVVVVLGVVVTAIGAVVAAAGPILIVVAVIAALAAVGYVVYRNWSTLKRTSVEVWHAIHKAVVTAVHAIQDVVHSVVGKVIVGVFKTAWGIIRTATQIEFALIQLLVINPIKKLWSIVKPILDLFARNWHTIWHAMGDVFSAVWNSLVYIAKPVLNALIDILNALLHGINAVIHGFNLIPGHHDVSPIPTIPHLATGSMNFPGGMAWVGERGPELVALPGGSRVFPSGHGGGGSTAINVVVNVPGGVVGTSPRELAELIRRELLLVASRNGGKVGLA